MSGLAAYTCHDCGEDGGVTCSVCLRCVCRSCLRAHARADCGQPACDWPGCRQPDVRDGDKVIAVFVPKPALVARWSGGRRVFARCGEHAWEAGGLGASPQVQHSPPVAPSHPPTSNPSPPLRCWCLRGACVCGRDVRS